MIPPKPAARQGKGSVWRFIRDFRRDILSAQSERLYHAWMAEHGLITGRLTRLFRRLRRRNAIVVAQPAE